jgi:hypothetical protein
MPGEAGYPRLAFLHKRKILALPAPGRFFMVLARVSCYSVGNSVTALRLKIGCAWQNDP